MRKYNIEQLIYAIQTSTSYRQTLIKLGLSDRGGNTASIKHKAIEYNIDTSHFTGSAHAKGKKRPLKTNINSYLSNEKPIGSFRLKNRLLREGYLKRECYSCSGIEWLSLPIPLELDHIDGNTSNNELYNLRLLCPNCHALTPTYRGKNQARAKKTMV